MRQACLGLALALLGGNEVHAEPNAIFGAENSLQIHGFLSQGYVKTNANQWFGPSDKGSWDFRELGLNASWRATPALQIAAQILSRTAGEMDDGGVRLDYGLLDWAAISDAERRFGLRLGRIKNPLGFYNETRDVAFTRPGIFLPQSVYFDRVRNLMLSADGVQLYTDWRMGESDLSFQLGLGLPYLDSNVEYTLMGRDWHGGLTGDDPMLLGQLAYEYDGGRFRFALSGVTVSLDFDPGANDPPPPLLDAGSIDMELWIASLQYNLERWSFTAEYLGQSVTWKNMGVAYNGTVRGEGYYLQATYRFAEPVEMFVRYSERFPDKNDRSGARMANQGSPPAISNFAKDWAVGIRWDPMQNLMFRLEYQWVDGTAWLSNRENEPADMERHWDMFAALISFRF